MLVRILNTLRSRIWDMVVFLFSDYSKPTVGENGGLYTNLFERLKKRKPKIWDRRKCEDSRSVENACLAFLLAPTSHILLYQISGFLFFGSRWKLVFKSWVGIRGLSRRLWFSLEWTSPERDTFLLDCIKITFIYSYLLEKSPSLSNRNH